MSDEIKNIIEAVIWVIIWMVGIIVSVGAVAAFVVYGGVWAVLAAFGLLIGWTGYRIAHQMVKDIGRRWVK